MNHPMSYPARLDRLKCCVIIPTYNNSITLKRVIDGVLTYTTDVIVVNDGSTDTTPQILADYPELKQIHLSQNTGKGYSLRTGFAHARALGFEYAITIDSDGQHFPDDIPAFIQQLENNPEPQLLIGSRNMNQEGVPAKSSFGNKFSNFWFWFETGHRLSDTQSGFRLYPLLHIPAKLFTNKFELEIEVIVRAAWTGVSVKNVPVKVLYDPDERVSHFRPFTDFARISILNTVLVLIAILYIHPRNFIRRLKKKGIKKFLLENILHSDDSSLKKSLSVALGVFIGIAPFWGFQTVLVLFLAFVFRLNKVISFAFSNISFPPFIPVIIYASLITGSLFVDSESMLPKSIESFEDVRQNLIQYLVGSFVFAAAMAALFGVVTFLLLEYVVAQKKQTSNA